MTAKWKSATSWLCALVACVTLGTAAAEELAVIELRHRLAGEVLPALQPLLEQGGAISAMDNKLLVRASSANIASLRQAAELLDRRQRQLSISVRRASRQAIERERLSASATVVAGDVQAGVNERPRAQSGAAIYATDSSKSRADQGVTTVQVLEGSEAFIATGASVPVTSSVVTHSYPRPIVQTETTYRDLNSGFYVVPRLSGDQVLLDVSQQHQRPLSGTEGAAATQSVATTVSGPLGQWLQLGGVSETVETNRSGILQRSHRTEDDELSVWIRAELVGE